MGIWQDSKQIGKEHKVQIVYESRAEIHITLKDIKENENFPNG